MGEIRGLRTARRHKRTEALLINLPRAVGGAQKPGEVFERAGIAGRCIMAHDPWETERGCVFVFRDASHVVRPLQGRRDHVSRDLVAAAEIVEGVAASLRNTIAEFLHRRGACCVAVLAQKGGVKRNFLFNVGVVD